MFVETMDHGRDEEAEQVLGDIIAAGGDVMSYLNETDGLEGEMKQATIIEQWRGKDMIMMAPVTEYRCKKETVMTAPVTE